MMAQSYGILLINQRLVLVLTAILVVLNVVLGWIALQIFGREKILTQWV